MPQHNFERPTLVLGQIADTSPRAIDSYINELFAQVSTISVAATPEDGTYTVRLSGPEGRVFDGSFVASSSTQAAIVAGLIASLETDNPDLPTVVALVDASPDIDLAFVHPGEVWVISFPSNPGPGDLSSVNDVEAGGVDVGLGLALVQGTADQHAVLPSADNGNVIVGISVRNVDVQTNDGLAAQPDGVAPGGQLSAMRIGRTAVNSTSTVAKSGAVFAQWQNPTAARPLGSLSATDDADTVQVPGAKWAGSRTGAGLVEVTTHAA